MRSSKIGLLRGAVSLAVATGALALPVASHATSAARPHISTGGATHVLGTSALLTAVINPNNVATSYYFQYGPTAAYGLQTPTVSAGSGALKLKVGQAVSGLQAGTAYHYRVVAVTSPPALPPAPGRDRVFVTKGTKLAFSVPRIVRDTFGSPLVLSGTLTGLGSQNHKVALQASPYPFLEPFASIGIPGVTNGVGAFSFRVANLATATQLRLVTLDALPVYSPVINVQVRVHVTLHVHASGQLGLVRLYGTITPSVIGAHVLFQVQKAVRPGKSEVSSKYVGQFNTVSKKGSAGSSRFSLIASIRHSGRYRAYVLVPKGPLASGPSQVTFVLHAGKGKG
jgi:hypothetical protein